MIEIVRADITTLDVDAIVNAANSALGGGGGVDGAIHRAAGPELAPAAMAHGRCPPGEAVVTPGFRLPARFVIHAVGPVWEGGNRDEPATLRRAYERAFELAVAEGSIRSIAFPAISTGVYGFPKRQAAIIALEVMREHADRFERIMACLFDEESVRLYRDELAGTLRGDVSSTPSDIGSRRFYHGTRAELKPGDLIHAGHSSNYTERRSPWVYFSETLDAATWGAELAKGTGAGRIYLVEPTGPFVDDPNLTDKKFPGNPTGSYRSRAPLTVVSEQLDWQGHSPEVIQAMKDGIAGLEPIDD